MEKYLKVTTNGELILVEIDENNLLDGFYSALNCRIIETVPNILARDVVFVVDEEGWLHEGAIHNLFVEPFSPGIVCGIAGDVLIARIGTRDGDTDLVGLSDQDIRFVSGLFEMCFGERLTRIGC